MRNVFFSSYLANHQVKTHIKANNYGIALALWSDSKDFTHGALRNVQLANIFLPKWKVRVFIPTNMSNKSDLAIKDNLLQKMRSLGADIVYVDMKIVKIPLNLINTLVFDEKQVTHFMIRDVRQRISGCDSQVTNDFITSDKSVRFVRYKDKNATILPQMWEGNRKKMKKRLDGMTMKQFIRVILVPC